MQLYASCVIGDSHWMVNIPKIDAMTAWRKMADFR
jgi:hypothetical protein